MATELLIWKGQTSQWINFLSFLFGFSFFWLILPPLFALWKYLTVKACHFELTTDGFTIQKGIFSTEKFELDLYKIKEIQLLEPFHLRLVNLSTIVLQTSDVKKPIIEIPAISKGKYLCSKFQMAVDQRRLVKENKDNEVD